MNETILDLQIATNEKNNPSFEQIYQWVSETINHQCTDGETIELCIRIVGKEESQSLNKNYRNKDKPTNVLSFYYQDDDWEIEEEARILGDLVICSDVVTEEALAQNKTTEAHWAHMVAHGILHLLNYDHQNHQDAQHMEAIEVAILKKMGYTNPYKEEQ